MSGAKTLPSSLAGLSHQAKGVCAAWFGMMRPGEGTLRFGMIEHRPSAIAQACLDEIVGAGIARRNEEEDGSVAYVPVVDCSPLLGWLAGHMNDPALRFPLTERISGGGGDGFSIVVSGDGNTVEAARMAVAGMRGRRGNGQ